MRRYKKQINSLTIYFFTLIFIITLLLIVALFNQEEKLVVSNINTIKSVETSRILPITTNIQDTFQVVNKFVKVTSTEEILKHSNEKIEFSGTLTGYGPDCVGCSGNLGCAPHPNVKNGNIYFEDTSYGKIRILAADPSIPCGSIIKVSNYPYITGDFYGIVLDRGSAIKGLTMDLLYNSEQETRNLGRAYNINFQIERWGY